MSEGFKIALLVLFSIVILRSCDIRMLRIKTDHEFRLEELRLNYSKETK